MSHGLFRLEQALINPPHHVALPELLDLWQHDDVVVMCQRPSDLEDCPDLPLRIRGALGNALEAMPADTRANAALIDDPFDRPGAHRLLFKWTPPAAGALGTAMPFVVRSEVRGDTVEVRLRLFGMASYLALPVMDGLIRAMEAGVSLRNHGVRARFAVAGAHIERFDGASYAWPQSASSATLTLVTPVIIRQGQSLRIEPVSLFRSVLRRAQAVAPWMQCRLLLDEAALMQQAAHYQCSMADIHPERWYRTSRNNPDRPLPMNGYGGRVSIIGNLAPWAPYLELAQFASLGGECALGFGAVWTSLYP